MDKGQGPAVAINGFGRIGRLVFRAIHERNMNAPPGDSTARIVAVNDLAPIDTLAHLLRFDSVHGRFPGTIDVEGVTLTVDGEPFLAFTEPDPANLPWKELGVDYVIDCTGRMTNRAALQKHLDAGAKRVILSAPGKGVDVTLVRGVNSHTYDPATHHLVSNASCTTNCLAPVLKVLNDTFGVDQAVMTSIHAYTNDQLLLDGAHKDMRRARAAATSMIPTTTGAARAIGLVLPELDGKVDGMAVRVPIPNVSLVDVNAELSRNVDRAEVEDAFRHAAENSLNGILECETRSLVSIDYNHHAASAVVDLPGLMIIDGRLVKVLAWYDNEWAYSMRTAELVSDMWAKETTHAPEAEARGA